MAQNFRLNEILDVARSDGKVLTEDLAQRFGVTVQTVRRDLGMLSNRGLLTRVYGGAVLASGTRNIGHSDRQELRAGPKEAIAQAAAKRIPNGASIFLDIGTTLEAVAKALHAHKNLLVVTNNLHVANILSTNPEAEVVLTGGTLRASDGGLVGEGTAEFVRQFKLDFALLGASALDQDGDALDFDFREVRVAQVVLSQARRSFLLADGSKFNRSAPVRIAPISAFDAFVTDVPPPASVPEDCRVSGCEIILARAD